MKQPNYKAGSLQIFTAQAKIFLMKAWFCGDERKVR
jgi:hypothetical protein